MDKIDVSFKELLIKNCLNILQQKENDFKFEINNLRDGIANDSKSSMGDKYETSREMSQQEINRLEGQLSKNKQQLFGIQNLNLETGSSKIMLGSLVTTNIGHFFLAVSLGQVNLENHSIFVVSPVSPIGKLLLNKSLNSQFEMNKKEIKILNII